MSAPAARMKTGIYYFTWYTERRWQEGRFKHAPLLGRYDSSDPAIVAWQLDLIRYCGIDYVIFELNPETDWGFASLERAIDAGIAYLRAHGMAWSFLLDAKSHPVPGGAPPPSEAAPVARMYRQVVERGWMDGVVRASSGKPLLFVYAPEYADGLAIRETLGAEAEWRMPIFLPEWHWDTAVEVSRVIPERYLDDVRRRLGDPRGRRVSVFDLLVALGYIAFWGETVRNFGGFCSVIPGYDDSLLGRSPQLAPIVDRRDGETFREQILAAARQEPEHLIVYGWNEYFEGTCVEPTREFGMRYVDLLRSLIAEGGPPAAPATPRRRSRLRRFW